MTKKTIFETEYDYYKRTIIEERLKSYPGKPLNKILDIEYDLDKEVSKNYNQVKEISSEKLMEELRKVLSEVFEELITGENQSQKIAEEQVSQKLELKSNHCPLAISLKWNSLGNGTEYLIFVDDICVCSTEKNHALLGVMSPREYKISLIAMCGSKILEKEIMMVEVAGLNNYL